MRYHPAMLITYIVDVFSISSYTGPMTEDGCNDVFGLCRVASTSREGLYESRIHAEPLRTCILLYIDHLFVSCNFVSILTLELQFCLVVHSAVGQPDQTTTTRS